MAVMRTLRSSIKSMVAAAGASSSGIGRSSDRINGAGSGNGNTPSAAQLGVSSTPALFTVGTRSSRHTRPLKASIVAAISTTPWRQRTCGVPTPSGHCTSCPRSHAWSRVDSQALATSSGRRSVHFGASVRMRCSSCCTRNSTRSEAASAMESSVCKGAYHDGVSSVIVQPPPSRSRGVSTASSSRFRFMVRGNGTLPLS